MKAQGDVLARYHRSRSRVSFIMGPLGSGKTIESCQKILKFMSKQDTNKKDIRPSRWFAVRNTYSELFSTTIKDWIGLFGDLGTFKQGGKEPPSWKARFEIDDGTIVESEMIFLALDRPEHVKKLRGAQATGFWLNEVKELPKAVVDMADLRHGRYPSKATGGVLPSWHGMIGDTNAPDDVHWYYKLAEEDRPEDWSFFRQPGGVIRTGKKNELGQPTFEANPNAENINNLPKGYYQKGMAGKSADWIAVNLGNEYGLVIDGKPVYPEYNDLVHCPEEGVPFLPHLPIGIGWDFGLTPCIVIVQITERGQLRIIDELVSENMGVKQFARDAVKPFLTQYLSQTRVGLSMGDPAGNIRHETDEKASLQILNDIRTNEDEDHFTPLELGFTTEHASSNVIVRRIGAVKHYLTKMVDGQPGLLIDRKCKVVRKGFQGGYKFRKLNVSGDERYKEDPEKNDYSHPHDALQYISMGALAGMISIEPQHDEFEDVETVSIWQ